MKSDPQYSGEIVYNNFPWPASATAVAKEDVETKAQAVLDSRADFPDSTLAELYDPLSMPAGLQKAHVALDRAVDRCYRDKKFAGDRERLEHLFELYEKLSAPLLPTARRHKAFSN
jgi:hypothetical protein